MKSSEDDFSLPGKVKLRRQQNNTIIASVLRILLSCWMVRFGKYIEQVLYPESGNLRGNKNMSVEIGSETTDYFSTQINTLPQRSIARFARAYMGGCCLHRLLQLNYQHFPGRLCAGAWC